MKFLLEYNKYKKNYDIGDIILIEYFYNDMITPVKIIEKVSKVTFKVSHNVPTSKIFNAPDELIKSSDIIDYSR